MSNEWYTPSKYIEAARKVMGSIDLDPASCELANRTVKAKRYYIQEQNGLLQPWYGNVWLNPPYGKIYKNTGTTAFVARLIEDYTQGNVQQAIILTMMGMYAAWFFRLLQYPGFCPTCLEGKGQIIRAMLQVKYNLQRVEKLGLPATLTVKQWLATLDDFSWMCAYCLTCPYSVLEHFIPINLEGGTTLDNVLPSCRSCNSRKLFYHPVDIFPVDVIERVTAYLQSKVVEVAL